MRADIIAMIAWGNPVPRSSACTTRAGRGLAVRRSEFGNRTRTTSPRLYLGLDGIVVVVGGHFGAVPVAGKGCQARTQLRRLGCVNPVHTQVHVSGIEEGHDDGRVVRDISRWFPQFDLPTVINAFNTRNHNGLSEFQWLNHPNAIPAEGNNSVWFFRSAGQHG